MGQTIGVVITPNRDPYVKSIEMTQLDTSHHFLSDFKIISEPKSRQLKTVTFRSTRNVNMMGKIPELFNPSTGCYRKYECKN